MSNGSFGLIAALVMLAEITMEERVAILRRAGDEIGGDGSSRRRASILDDDLLAENLAHAVGQHARA